MSVVKLGHTIAVPLLALPWALFAAPSSGAALTPAAGGASSGSSASVTGQRILPTAGLRGTTGRGIPSPDTLGRTQSSSALDYDGLSFYPGFANGCASARDVLGTNGIGPTLAAAATPLAPERAGGRFFNISVSGSAVYTDNLQHEQNGESEFILQLAPRITACQRTGRIRASLSYQLKGVAYAENTDASDLYHEVAGDATINVIPGHLYLDLNTRYGQTIATPSSGFSGTSSLAPDNQTSRWSSNISPFVVQSLGPIGRARLRYRYGYTTYGNESIPDVTVHGVYLNITSPVWRDTVTWKAHAVSQYVERSGGDLDQFFRNQNVPSIFRTPQERRDRTTHFGTATLQIGWRVSPTFKLFARGGVEDAYKPDGSVDKYASTRASVGFRKELLRYSLSAHAGLRFDELSYGLKATYDGPTFFANLGYREETSSQGLQAANSATLVNPRSVGLPNRLFGRGVFIEQRWTASLGFATALTRVTLRGYHSTREYQRRGVPEQTDKGASLKTVYQLQPRTTLTAHFSWDSRSSRRFGYDRYEAGLSAARLVQPTLQVSLGYSRHWRDDNGYVANVVSLQFIKSF